MLHQSVSNEEKHSNKQQTINQEQEKRESCTLKTLMDLSVAVISGHCFIAYKYFSTNMSFYSLVILSSCLYYIIVPSLEVSDIPVDMINL